jgi:hypothetical protein
MRINTTLPQLMLFSKVDSINIDKKYMPKKKAIGTNINSINKYKEFKEKKVYLLEMRILQHLSDKKINNGQNEKYKKSKKKP